MAFHHVVKFLVNLLVFLLSARSENIGGVCIGTLTSSVLLLVQGLYMQAHTGGGTEHMKVFLQVFTLDTESTSRRRLLRDGSVSHAATTAPGLWKSVYMA